MLLISDAVTAGIDMIESEKWRREQQNARRRGWDRWHSQYRPELVEWQQLQPGHIFEYHQWLKDQYAPPTVNNFLNPIRKAHTFVALYHPHLYKPLFVKNVIRAKPRPMVKRYIVPHQLVQAVTQARNDGEPAVVAALMFGGLAGLDIGEIMRIQAGDIRDDVLVVRGEKNAYRERIVPMVSTLAEFGNAWKSIFAQMPIKTDGALSSKARRVLNACADATGDRTFKMVTLHDSTRVTFVNLTKNCRCELEAIRAYIGHAPESVLTEHYADMTPREGDLPLLHAEKLNDLRQRICAKIETKISDAFGAFR